MDHDRLFKQLLTTFFFEFVDLFLPEVAQYLARDKVEFLDKEVFTDLAGGERHEVDVVAKCRFRGRDAFFLIHAENQSRSEGGFPRRMFHYFARLDEAYALPVYPVALFSHAAPHRPEDDRYQVEFPDKTVMDFNFRVIQLNRMDWRTFAQTDNPVAAALMTRMRIAPDDRAKAKLACVRIMLRLPLNDAQLALVGEFVDSYLELDDHEQAKYEEAAKELVPLEQEKVMAVMNEWTKAGLKKGLEQGLERQRAMLLRQLRWQVGELSPAVEERVRKLPADRLEDLGEALLSMSKPAELEAWLAARD